MTEERWQQNLLEQLERGRLALFIGADLPREVTGLPARAELAQDLARRYELDTSYSLAEVTQRISRAGNRWEFTNFIRDAVDTAGKPTQPFRQRIVELVKNQRIETLITTAYDDLLEQAFRESSVGFNRVVRGSDVSFVDPDRPTLIRLYGDAQQPDTLVVTEDDHYGLWRDRDKEDLLEEVRAALRKNTVLFLGYNLADPDFNLLWREVLDRAGRFGMTAYAVWPGLEDSDVNMWKDRGIVILQTDPLGILGEGVIELQAAGRTEATVAVPAGAAVTKPPPVPQEPGWVPVKLQIARLSDLEFGVRALETPMMGEPRATSRLPYDATDFIAVLKVLEHGCYDPDRFNPAQSEALQKAGLLSEGRLVPGVFKQIGSGLHQALFPDQVGVAFQMAFNQARSARDTIALQLRLDQDAVALARYPWELMHDGYRHLLSGGVVELTRYISYPEAVTPLRVAPPWRLLFIAARPQDLDELPDDAERLVVWDGLQAVAETGKLRLDLLDPPTYDALVDRMSAVDYHIVHFDGHGVFARRCPECGTMHYPHIVTCQACAAPLSDVSPMGYLAFEDNSGDADYVSTEAMENVLLTSQVRLVLLSACQSAVVRGESLFGGLGPGLIRAGVPAVAAMQFSVPVDAAVDFSRAFYTALAQGKTVPRAVAQGRRRLFRDKHWFIPTLYLRSSDDEGRLFVE